MRPAESDSAAHLVLVDRSHRQILEDNRALWCELADTLAAGDRPAPGAPAPSVPRVWRRPVRTDAFVFHRQARSADGFNRMSE